MNNPTGVGDLSERVAAGLGPLPAMSSRVSEAPGRAAGGILEVLEQQPEPVTVAELSEATGQHPNTVREHLDALVEADLVERTPQQTSGRGRPAWLYAVRPPERPASPEYAGLASALARQIATTSPDPQGEAAAAGEDWGRRLAEDAPAPGRGAVAARRGVVDLLGGLGFEPKTNARATTTRLTRCPLLETAIEHPEVVCSVHLGIVRGALESWGSTDTPAGLVPFAEPGACLLHVGPGAEQKSGAASR